MAKQAKHVAEDKSKVLSDITQFSKDSLKKTAVCEGNNAVAGLAMEQTLAGVANFAKDKLTHVTTEEKNTLPTREVIDQEKKSGF